MLKRLFKPLFTATVLTTALTSPAYADEQKELNFGIISTESSQNLKTIWQPFLDDMERKTGMEIKPFFAPDYAGIIQGMRFDKVDLAWYGNKSAMEAVDRAGGEVFAQTVDVTGNPGYWSLIITHKDNDINSLEQMFAKSSDLIFGNGDPNSTSGFLVPSYYVFAMNNVDPKKAFKRTLNSGHESNLLAVANKQVDVATNNTESLARLQITHPDKAANIKIVWKSPLIPADPIVWRKNLSASTKDKIYTFFMTYGTTGDKQELKTLENLQWAPFKASSDEQLLPIRQLAMFKAKAAIENDSSLSAAEKSKKVAEIHEKLANYERHMAALNARI